MLKWIHLPVKPYLIVNHYWMLTCMWPGKIELSCDKTVQTLSLQNKISWICQILKIRKQLYLKKINYEFLVIFLYSILIKFIINNDISVISLKYKHQYPERGEMEFYNQVQIAWFISRQSVHGWWSEQGCLKKNYVSHALKLSLSH